MTKGTIIVFVLALVLTTAVVYGASQDDTEDVAPDNPAVTFEPVRSGESPDPDQDEAEIETEADDHNDHGDIDVLTWDEAVEAVRSHAVQRDASFTLCIEPVENGRDRIGYAVIEHTGVPDEGDYLRRTLLNLNASVMSNSEAGIGDYDIYTFTPTYDTTKEQEDALAARIDEILSQLGIYSMENDLDKITAVYQWITEHVTYDHDHLGDSSYRLQYTAYAALFDGTAVCSGCSALLYRMLLTAGIDNRIIGNDDHTWNIIALDGVYYNADVTWDLGKSPEHFRYLLKGSDTFYERHVPSAEYETESFRLLYYVPNQDYVFPVTENEPVSEQTEDESEPEVSVQYVTSLSEVPAAAMEQMKSQAVSAYYTDFVPVLSDNFEVQSFEYIGSYFLSAKEGTETDIRNRIILMYKVDATAYGKDSDGNVNCNPFTYYTYYEFDNGIIDTDGTFRMDYSDYSVCENTVVNIVLDYTVPEKSKQKDSLTCFGFMNLGTAFDKIVTANAGQYEFESTIQEEAATAEAENPDA